MCLVKEYLLLFESFSLLVIFSNNNTINYISIPLYCIEFVYFNSQTWRNEHETSDITCGNGLALGDHDVIVLAAGTHAEEGTIDVHTLGFTTHTAQQLTLVHICGRGTEEHIDTDSFERAWSLASKQSRHDIIKCAKWARGARVQQLYTYWKSYNRSVANRVILNKN